LAAEWFLVAPSDDKRGTALFPGLSLEQVASVEISDRQGPLRMRRNADGFVLPDWGDFPVLESALKAPVEGLARLTSLDRAGSGNDAASYGLAEGQGVLLALRDGAGALLAEVELGQPPGRGPGRAGVGVFVRVRGTAPIYAAPWLMPLSTAPRAYWDGRLLQFEPSTLASLRLSGERLGSPLELQLTRSGAGFVASDGTALPLPAVEGLLLALGNLYLDGLRLVDENPAATPGPAFSPALRLELEAADGTRQTLEFGPFDPASSKTPVAVRAGHWPSAWRGEISGQSMLDWMGPASSPLGKLLLHTNPR
jgi:hypothetical protein